jgi:hypothetical protein
LSERRLHHIQQQQQQQHAISLMKPLHHLYFEKETAQTRGNQSWILQPHKRDK